MEEEKNNNVKKYLIIVVCAILIICITIAVCFFIKDKLQTKKEDSSPKESQDNVVVSTDVPATAVPTSDISEPVIEERILSKTELVEIEEYIKNKKVNFLVSEFTEPKDANVYLQIRYGYDSELIESETTRQEQKDVLLSEESIKKDVKDGKYTIDEYINELENIIGSPVVIKYKKDDLNTYLINNLDVTVDEVDLSFMKYLSKYDAYYMEKVTDAFVKDITVLGGKINKDGLYEIEYKSTYDLVWTATLKKVEDRYVFISNINKLSDKIKEIESTAGLKVINGTYGGQSTYKIYYKDDSIYYVVVIDNAFDNVDKYYFEDNNYICKKTNSYHTEEYDTYYYTALMNEINNAFANR